MNKRIEEITARIKKRSTQSRAAYLKLMKSSLNESVTRGDLACGNLAHAFAQLENVLLIDADMRRPSIGKELGLPRDMPGLFDQCLEMMD